MSADGERLLDLSVDQGLIRDELRAALQVISTQTRAIVELSAVIDVHQKTIGVMLSVIEQMQAKCKG